eukprot:gene4008-7985_t
MFNKFGSFLIFPLSTCTGAYFTKTTASCDYSELVHVERFQGQTVLIRDKHLFEKKKAKFVSEGPHKFEVVSDFDYTLTKYKMKGIKGRSCHGVIESMMSKVLQDKADELMHFYYPMEISHTMDVEEKSVYMVEWTVKSHNLIVQSGICRADIKAAAAKNLLEGKVALRDGVGDFFASLAASNVPILIFSAGIGDIVEEVLRQGVVDQPPFTLTGSASRGPSSVVLLNGDGDGIPSALPSNVHVVSNRMIFSGNEPSAHLIGFDEQVFHVFNKKGSSILHTPFLQTGDLCRRKNLLLIGDSLGDPHMAEGLPHSEDSIIRIGFLNDHLDRLPLYLTAFDVVILGDPGFDIPLAIVDDVIATGTRAGAASP